MENEPFEDVFPIEEGINQYFKMFFSSRKHRKITIRRFGAESLALVFRRIPASQMSQVWDGKGRAPYSCQLEVREI